MMAAIDYDRHGQLLSGSLLDYALPRTSDAPPITVMHHQTPSPFNPLGVKGLVEGGAIAPAVVIANGLAEALRDCDHEFNSLPIRATAVREAVAKLLTNKAWSPESIWKRTILLR
jgi:carbon-monoxide dehydrogenase large subunit